MTKVNELERQLEACTDPKKYDGLLAQIAEARKSERIDAAIKRQSTEAELARLRKQELEALANLTGAIESDYEGLLEIDQELFSLIPQVIRLANERVSLGEEVRGKHESADELARKLGEKAPARKAQHIFGGDTIRPLWKTGADYSTFIRIWLCRVADALHDSPNGEIKPEDIHTGRRGNLGIDDKILPSSEI
jgi:hypothetical protein